MRFFYSFFVQCYSLVINLAALFNPKAKLFIDGRRNIFDKIKSQISSSDASIVWFHCASLGEFEQGRPLIEKIKLEEPQTKILLTFFSPSGFEIRKNYQTASWVFYLPIDSISNSKKFIELVNPKMAIFVKYEFWFNYLQALFDKKIPTYFISVNVRPTHYFLKWYGTWALAQLKKINHFFVQNKTSFELLKNAGVTPITIAGDTRFDRVLAIAKESKSIPIVEQFVQDSNVIIAGSTWREDESKLADLLSQLERESKKVKLIIAPHEISESRLREVEELFQSKKIIRYSITENGLLDNFDVLLIDNIGMLSALYKYATISYIGGGFGKGIHNILEAAVYGKPVLFGPNFRKFEEAKELIRIGGALSFSTGSQLQIIVLELLSNKKNYHEKCELTQAFVHDNSGAVEIISKRIN